MEKRQKYLIAFILMGLYLSLLETLIPKPFPWMKIGLANIVVIIALEKFDSKMALEITVMRSLIQGVVLGTLFSPGFFISLISGVISTLSSICLFKWREYLSLIAISVFSAFLHNICQLIIVYFLMFRNIDINGRGIYIFITIFLIMGCVAGAITGAICEKMRIRREKK